MQMGKPKECNGIRNEWRISVKWLRKKKSDNGGKRYLHTMVDDDENRCGGVGKERRRTEVRRKDKSGRGGLGGSGRVVWWASGAKPLRVAKTHEYSFDSSGAGEQETGGQANPSRSDF
jgi:hypothetical protein